MRKSLTLLAAVAIAGAAFAGASAFTASNTMPDKGVFGYGEVQSSGASIASMSVSPLQADASKLAEVTFTTGTVITGKTVTMTLKKATAVIGSPYACTFTTANSVTTISCPTVDHPGIDAFDTTGVTVV